MNYKSRYTTTFLATMSLLSLNLSSCDDNALNGYDVQVESYNNHEPPSDPPTDNGCLPGFVQTEGKCVEKICAPDSVKCCISDESNCNGVGISICNHLGTSYQFMSCDKASQELQAMCPAQCLPPDNNCLPGFVKVEDRCVEIICVPDSVKCCSSDESNCNGVGISICNHLGTSYQFMSCDKASQELQAMCPAQCQSIVCKDGSVYDPETKECKPICDPDKFYNSVTKKCETIDLICPEGFVKEDSKCIKHYCSPHESMICCDSSFAGCEDRVGIIGCDINGYGIYPCDAYGDTPPFPEECQKCQTNCPEGQKYDLATNTCVHICPPHAVYQIKTKQCVKKPDANECLEGFIYNDPKCNDKQCTPGQVSCCDSSHAGCDNSSVVVCDESGKNYSIYHCKSDNTDSNVINTCLQCYGICPEDTQYNSTTGKCEPVQSDQCIQFIDPQFNSFAISNTTGWDTNYDGCITRNEASAVTSLDHSSFDGSSIRTLDDLSNFKRLSHFNSYAIKNCNNLKKVTLKYVKSFETYSILRAYNIDTLILPRANHFETYFVAVSLNLKHLFLTAPGDFTYDTYSFLALTKDIHAPNWADEFENVNKDVTLYLSRDKLNSSNPRIVSPTEWGNLFPEDSRNETYRWKAIYVCDDYATDISQCELVK